MACTDRECEICSTLPNLVWNSADEEWVDREEWEEDEDEDEDEWEGEPIQDRHGDNCLCPQCCKQWDELADHGTTYRDEWVRIFPSREVCFCHSCSNELYHAWNAYLEEKEKQQQETKTGRLERCECPNCRELRGMMGGDAEYNKVWADHWGTASRACFCHNCTRQIHLFWQKGQENKRVEKAVEKAKEADEYVLVAVEVIASGFPVLRGHENGRR